MSDLAPLDRMDEAEAALLAMPQVEIETIHHFGPGVYIREIVIPEGVTLIGHAHKGPHLCQLLRGTLRVIDGDGDSREITGPTMFTAPPGRKLGFAVTECSFLNIHGNPDDETDMDVLQERFVSTSDTWKEARKCLG